MKTVILLRHADVDAHAGPAPDAQPLNAAGRARAQALARAVGAAGVSVIYVSPAARTQETVAPLAAELGVAPAVTPGPAAFAAEVAAAGSGSVILVAGHSNTVPALIAGLGAASPVALVEGHDDLFVVTIGAGASVLRLKYGAAQAPRPGAVPSP
ncbi:Histidine phosphatase superfamily (branch 1) [Gemmata obscuriglobus]|uniref:Histidine phosphatase family protein n=1 Tax=Gemmata obscuriglobus TaxID=114 RepID=A0A2Z3GZK0_9BACT|nr:histidine phosphatase family protein [Gemmata obscuriglobus]AWM36726.1 histidine phosphatase family protein [Gemmata obscuriglobus]QEG30623.1 Histidine phosphatase superfamily (branch 1) [Gemmata obscuriglobus]VTS09947.1 Phosphoglycerate mutase OS=Actinoplanes sp. (strain ATCC 31044 / CBS 674.73 / SE50/110) GN=ACPL_2641 PE=4 SV=1: His_Phos_1 [Gemmata obscuriglobus UQM 2246]